MKKHTYTQYTVTHGGQIVWTGRDYRRALANFQIYVNKGGELLEAKSEEWIPDTEMTALLVEAYNDYIRRTFFCYQGFADDYEPERDDARPDGDLTNLGLLYTSDGGDTCYQWTLNIPERTAWCQIEGDDDHCVDCFFKDEDELLQWLTDLDEDLLIETAEPHVENFNRRHA